jgi:hypothetical protein
MCLTHLPYKKHSTTVIFTVESLHGEVYDGIAGRETFEGKLEAQEQFVK